MAMTADSKKVAVLGLGSIGMRHARNLAAHGVQVFGYDPDPERRASLASMGQESADTRDEAIGKTDAVIIASPTQYHLEDLKAVVSAGRHALVEKPLAHTDAGLAAILAEAQGKSLNIVVGHNLRHHPAVIAAREIIADGALGTPTWSRMHFSSWLPDWRPGTDYRKGYAADPKTGGVMFDLSHEFDLAVFLLGPASVSAAVARNTGLLEIASEDCADILLAHESGVCSSLHLDYASHARRRVAEVGGGNGRLSIDLDARHLTQFNGKNGCIRDETFTGDYGTDYAVEIASFLACVRGEAEPVCPASEAMCVLNLVLNARQRAGLPQG